MVQYKKREDVPQGDRWNLESMYADDGAWASEFASLQSIPEQAEAWKGRLGESIDVLKQALDFYFGSMRKIEKVYTYAHLRHDEDLSEGKYHEYYSKARALYFQFDAATSFVNPELLGLDESTLRTWKEDPQLAEYQFFLSDLLRQKPHTLSPSEERIISMAQEAMSTGHQVFSMLNNVDLPARFGEVTNEDGEQVKLTHSTYYKLTQARERDIRRGAFQGFYREFKGNRNTMAAALDGSTKAHVFESRVRGYASARESALFDDNISVDVYDGLIEAIHEKLPDYQRYMNLRKRVLGLDELHFYDLSVPIIDDLDLKYTWEEAEGLIAQALVPLGKEYSDIMKKGLADRWIDRYENEGKRTGAYSSGCYDSMPYILHNFNGLLGSVFTLAHELGHSMHTELANRTQPYPTANYRIFVAEVASTTNEGLLIRYMLDQNKDPKVRAYLLNHYIKDFCSTMFRQTMFAEFERDMHEMVESGEGALTAETLDAKYREVVYSYFGDTIAWDEDDEMISWEWSRIPHMYYNFYVYKYATGMAAATSITQAILQEGSSAVERYLNFLKSGGSKYPLDLLKGAGVDLTTPEPVRDSLKVFSSLIDELESLLG